MSEKCPKCGAPRGANNYSWAGNDCYYFSCGSGFYKDNMDMQRQSKQCLRNQIAALQAIVDKLPKNAEDKAICVGDTIWADDPDGCGVISGIVSVISSDVVFDEYIGAFTIGLDDYECGNLECHSTLEDVQAAKEGAG